MPGAQPVPCLFETPCGRLLCLECGPADGKLMIFVHGWPASGLLWRAQLEAFAADGWHCVAPDLRGCGGSFTPATTDAYTVEAAVADLAALHDALGGRAAVWVGHDWGSAVVGALAAHRPERSRGVVLCSLPYFPDAFVLSSLVPLVDRAVYPADRFPDGQWDYYRYYTTHFEDAVADLDADRAASLASIYRRGDPGVMGTVLPAATVTRNGGRFGAARRAPPTQADPALWPAADFAALVDAFDRQGFRPACAWYLNGEANRDFARRAPDGGRLPTPVLFVNGDLDGICSIVGNRQGDPMRAACAHLTVARLPGAHWLPVECKAELVQAIRGWLRDEGL